MLAPYFIRNLANARLRRIIIWRGLILLLILSLLAGTTFAQNDRETALLEVGKPIERELAGGQAHSYGIALAAGQYLHVIVDQRGIDVVLTLYSLDGKKLAEIDSPNGPQGPEPLFFIAQVQGRYRLEVRSLDKGAPKGRYQAQIVEMRAATSQDAARLATQKLYEEGLQLQQKGTRGSLQAAIKSFEEARSRWHAGGNRNEEANALDQIGGVYYLLGEMQKALEYFNQELPLRRALNDRSGEAIALSNIGVMYNKLGEKRKAIDYYNQSLTPTRAVRDRIGEAITLNSIGLSYIELGEPQKALDILVRQSLPIRRELKDRDGEARTLHNIAIAYFRLGDREKALAHNLQSLEIFRAINNRNGESVALSLSGAIYADLGNQQKALEQLTQALKIDRATGNRFQEADTLRNIGTIYQDQKEFPKALEYYKQSLEIGMAIGARPSQVYDLNRIGSVYNDLNDRVKALNYLNRALELSRAVGDRWSEAQTLYGMASAERARRNLADARQRIESAISIVESIRIKINSQELRASYRASIQRYYDLYINILMQLHEDHPSEGHEAEALQVSERARARTLLETLNEAGADIRQGADPKLIERERVLQEQLNAKATQQIELLNGARTQDQAKAIAEEIDALTSEYQQIKTQIRQSSPRYAALTQPEPLTLREIQTKVLDPDTLLLEYALGEEKSYLWAVTQTSIRAYELPKRAEIEEIARRAYEQLSAHYRSDADETVGKRGLGLNQSSDNNGALRRNATTRLSEMILTPVASQLGTRRLAIVADGALQYVPFAALQIPSAHRQKGPRHSKAKQALSTDNRPLIVEHEIVSLPSASTLSVLRREVAGRRPAPKVLAVVADPVFESSDARVHNTAAKTTKGVDQTTTLTDESRGLGLDLKKSAQESGLADTKLHIPRLLGTRREAEQILALVPPTERKEAIDFAASRATAMSAELGQYRLIHMATHGLLDSVHPELSGIVLSMVDEKGAPQDGFLRAHEVFNLRLPAELVVLSACQTGLGKEIRGEGLVGLTRGLMYAGAPRVVVSLWSVSDEATAELMTSFYRKMLKDGLRPAAALRAAQIEIWRRKRWQSPFYWAAFTLQGEWK